MEWIRGIDVSGIGQGANFDWEAAIRHGKQFAFMKATEGTGFLDPDFARNWRVSAERGMPVRGAYHFYHPSQSPDRQAQVFLARVRECGLAPGNLLMVDYESMDDVPASRAAEDAAKFCSYVSFNADCACIVYTTPAMAASGYCDGLEHYPLFLADPGNPNPEPVEPWDLLSFAQIGQRGVDQDLAFFDSVDQIRLLGCGGGGHNLAVGIRRPAPAAPPASSAAIPACEGDPTAAASGEAAPTASAPMPPDSGSSTIPGSSSTSQPFSHPASSEGQPGPTADGSVTGRVVSAAPDGHTDHLAVAHRIWRDVEPKLQQIINNGGYIDDGTGGQVMQIGIHVLMGLTERLLPAVL
jgi:lysozyme